MTATLYELVTELRREHPTPSAARTLDMVVAELGQTQDNLQRALERLELRPVPTGGKEVLAQLAERARADGIDDLNRLPGTDRHVVYEPVDESQTGIAFLLALSSIAAVGLAIAAIVAGLHAI
jgi:hypothetical protein